jgi:hypothetical protein
VIGWAWPLAGGIGCLILAWIAARRRRCAVYEHYGWDGRIVYVGMSCNPPVRDNKHRRKSWWWSSVDPRRKKIRWYPSVPRARAEERATIRRLHPFGNVVHNGRWAAPRPGRVRVGSGRGWG